jgi:hypothetical protein
MPGCPDAQIPAAIRSASGHIGGDPAPFAVACGIGRHWAAIGGNRRCGPVRDIAGRRWFPGGILAHSWPGKSICGSRLFCLPRPRMSAVVPIGIGIRSRTGIASACAVAPALAPNPQSQSHPHPDPDPRPRPATEELPRSRLSEPAEARIAARSLARQTPAIRALDGRCLPGFQCLWGRSPLDRFVWHRRGLAGIGGDWRGLARCGRH